MVYNETKTLTFPGPAIWEVVTDYIKKMIYSENETIKSAKVSLQVMQVFTASCFL